jgi:hypothetical protein
MATAPKKVEELTKAEKMILDAMVKKKIKEKLSKNKSIFDKNKPT